MVNDFVKVNKLLPLQNATNRHYHLPNMSGNVCNTTVTAILNQIPCIAPFRFLKLLLFF